MLLHQGKLLDPQRRCQSLWQHVCLLPRRHTCRQQTAPVAMGRRGLADLMRRDRETEQLQGRKPLQPGMVSPLRDVPQHIKRPPYVGTGTNPWIEEIQQHSSGGIKKMRAACKLAAEVLEYAGTLVKPGITTEEIDQAVHQMIIDNNAYPSPLTYGNFPKSVCTSVNECICHGIPDSRTLQDGDIVNIDVTVYLNGYHGDTSRMYYAGDVSERARRLCETTHLALTEGIKVCGPNIPISAIGKAIHAVADKHSFGVVREFVGHGVGQHFHSLPIVQHHRNNTRDRMVPGMTFTIEPMLTAGSIKGRMWKDNWTVVTVDGSLSAQFEHTILITNSGHEVLTTWPSRLLKPR